VAYAWMPGVKCIRAETDGGPLRGGAPRAVWLTLGARPGAVSVQSAAERLLSEGRPCHLIWDPVTGDIAQLISILRAGRALGTPECLSWRGHGVLDQVIPVSSDGRICAQLGVLARPDEPFTNGPLPGLATILGWLDSWNVPRRWPAGAPAATGELTGQRSRRRWAQGGHFGASQVPECQSFGPGAIDIDRLTGAHLVPVTRVSKPPGPDTDIDIRTPLAAAVG
jgi:hypothetical protein